MEGNDYAKEHQLTPDEARKELVQTALGLVDEKWSQQEHIQANSTDRAKEALLALSQSEDPLTLFSQGEGWTGSKEIALFTASEEDFKDTYLFAGESANVERGYNTNDPNLVAPLQDYLKRYALAEGQEPLPAPSDGEVVDKIGSDASDTYDTIADAIERDGVLGTLGNVADGVKESLSEFADDCVERGIKCATPEIATHGTAADRALIDSLLQDEEALLENSADNALTAGSVATLGTGTVVKGVGKEVLDIAKDSLKDKGDTNTDSQANSGTFAGAADSEAGNPDPLISATSYFDTKGLDPEAPEVQSVRGDLFDEYKIAGLPDNIARELTDGVIKSGSTIPEKRLVSHDETLYKFVPSGNNPGRSSYYFTKKEFEYYKNNPEKLAQEAGLPYKNFVGNYDVYAIKPKPEVKPVVFESKVAEAKEDGYHASGGASQTIVPNLKDWSAPEKVDDIKVYNSEQK